MLTKTVIENILILLGESFWVFSIYAQLRKLLKTRNKLGLSAVTQTLNAAGNVAWATYFANRHLWLPFTTNIVMFFLTVVILGYILTNRKQFTKGLLTIAIVGPLTSYLIIKLPHTSGWLGVAYNSLSTLPWFRHLVVTKKSSGISHHTSIFTYGAISCTLSYAILIISFPLITGCLLGFVYTTAIAGYYRNYRHN